MKQETYSVEYFKTQGKIGGQTYAKKYTKKQRSEIAKKRWAKMKGEAFLKYVKKTLKNKSPNGFNLDKNSKNNPNTCTQGK